MKVVHYHVTVEENQVLIAVGFDKIEDPDVAKTTAKELVAKIVSLGL